MNLEKLQAEAHAHNLLRQEVKELYMQVQYSGAVQWGGTAGRYSGMKEAGGVWTLAACVVWRSACVGRSPGPLSAACGVLAGLLPE